MMGKKAITAILLFILIISSSGCTGAIRRKFVRKKKGEVKEEPVLQPKEYDKEFTSRQLYANHFAFWRAAEAEFINCLKARKGRKRLITYTSYAVSELKKLYDLLIEGRQKELRPFIEELEEIAAKINQSDYLDSHHNFLVDKSSKHYRAVSRKFSYYSMREHIRLEKASAAEAASDSEPTSAAVGAISSSEPEATSSAEPEATLGAEPEATSGAELKQPAAEATPGAKLTLPQPDEPQSQKK